MSRLEVPLAHRTLRTTGDVLLWAELTLQVRTNRGSWVEITFLVDSGTEMTTTSVAEARKLDLPIPRRPVPNLKHTQTGLEIRAGLLRARIVGLDATEFVFPCYFLGDPYLPPPPQVRNLLGLSGVINQIRLVFDGTPGPNAQYGLLIVEKI
jgi:hypothetical protein